MATLTLSLPDEQLSRLRRKAEERGLESPERLVLALVDSELSEESSVGDEWEIVSDPPLFEKELVRRLDGNDFVVMDEADLRSIGEEVQASIRARIKP